MSEDDLFHPMDLCYLPDDGVRIMLTGAARSGKSTMAEMIAEQIPQTRVIAFADELKILSADFVNTAMENMGVRNWKPIDVSSIDSINKRRELLRVLWQWFGTDLVRSHEEGFWIEQLALSLNYQQPKNIVVSDCRFSNEHIWGRRNGFITVRIVRDKNERVPDHESERMWSTFQCDIEYENNKSLEEMHYWIFDILVPRARDWSKTFSSMSREIK